ncbi:MAG: hypothetical protein K0V04_31210 [Deltaproteobacteria bacterium]|nr:hypothetical protein [Deltaproteobacteria bacterium]
MKPPVLPFAAVLWTTTALGCGRATPPPSPPSEAIDPNSVLLRYAAPATVLEQQLQLDLTHTSVGSYVEATLRLRAALELETKGEALHVAWALSDIETLELGGTAEPEDTASSRTLLMDHGQGSTVSDVHGQLDALATSAAAPNAARERALSGEDGAPPSPIGVLLMTALEEQLRLPRLPTQALALDQPVEIEEESETVLADAELVLPTTTVLRFTLRSVDDAGIASVAVELASVAQPDTDPDAEDSGPRVRLETRSEGTLLFDVQQGIPVSLALTRNELIQLGERQGERSLNSNSQYRIP